MSADFVAELAEHLGLAAEIGEGPVEDFVSLSTQIEYVGLQVEPVVAPERLVEEPVEPEEES